MDENIFLEELSVTIKTIKVNSKKMTQSMFKQLPEENILNSSTFELKGTPWGKVNYYWGKQKTWGTIHLLWSKNNELKRCLIEGTGIANDMYLKKRHEEERYISEYTYDLDNIYSGDLRSIVRSAREEEEKKQGEGEKIFFKYNKAYNELNKLEQLFL